MKNLLNSLRGVGVALALALAALLPSEGALAQAVGTLPTAIAANTVVDFGSGPFEFRVVLGNAWIFTFQGNNGSLNTADAGTTTLTLASTPAVPPCIGCVISGSGITPGTTVTAFNGTTGITLSAAMTIPANTLIQWGATCPTFAALGGLPPAPNLAVQPGGLDTPMFTFSHICGLAANGPGAQIITFPIGAH